MGEFLWNAATFFGDFSDPNQWIPPGVPPGASDLAVYAENPTGVPLYVVNITMSVTVGANLIDDTNGEPLFVFDSGGVMTTGGFDFVTSAGMLLLPGSKLDVTTQLTAANADTIGIVGDGPASGGTVELASSSIGAFGSNMTFNFDNVAPTGPNGGVIEFDSVAGTTTTQVITNVADGNEFVIGGHDFTGDTVNYSGTTLTVMNGGSTVFTMDNVTAVPGTTFVIADTNIIEAVCYARGTMIRTPDGELPIEKLRSPLEGETAVEDLQIGDLVCTASGAAKPIKWIGRLSYSAAAVAEAPHLRPVLIRKDALGAGLPRRDLMVSPMHALHLDDAFVPASALVNGVSILRREGEGPVDYIHIELHDHDVLLAEGVPAESFVDDDSRSMFDNASEYYDLYGFAERQRTFCAPRLEEGYRLEAIRRRLAARAGIVPSTGAPGEMAGHVERLCDGKLEGWVMDRANPNTPVELEVLVDSEIVATLLANHYRSDLDRAGLAGGRCAFTLAMPAAAEDISQVEVRRSSDGGQVPMPQRVHVTA